MTSITIFSFTCILLVTISAETQPCWLRPGLFRGWFFQRGKQPLNCWTVNFFLLMKNINNTFRNHCDTTCYLLTISDQWTRAWWRRWIYQTEIWNNPGSSSGCRGTLNCITINTTCFPASVCVCIFVCLSFSVCVSQSGNNPLCQLSHLSALIGFPKNVFSIDWQRSN